MYFPKHLKLSIAINVIVVKSEVYEVQLSMNPDSSVYYHHILSFFCFSYIIHSIFVGRIVLGEPYELTIFVGTANIQPNRIKALRKVSSTQC